MTNTCPRKITVFVQEGYDDIIKRALEDYLEANRNKHPKILHQSIAHSEGFRFIILVTFEIDDV